MLVNLEFTSCAFVFVEDDKALFYVVSSLSPSIIS